MKKLRSIFFIFVLSTLHFHSTLDIDSDLRKYCKDVDSTRPFEILSDPDYINVLIDLARNHENPLRELVHNQSSFTTQDLGKYINSRWPLTTIIILLCFCFFILNMPLVLCCCFCFNRCRFRSSLEISRNKCNCCFTIFFLMVFLGVIGSSIMTLIINEKSLGDYYRTQCQLETISAKLSNNHDNFSHDSFIGFVKISEKIDYMTNFFPNFFELSVENFNNTIWLDSGPELIVEKINNLPSEYQYATIHSCDSNASDGLSIVPDYMQVFFYLFFETVIKIITFLDQLFINKAFSKNKNITNIFLDSRTDRNCFNCLLEVK